MHKFYLSLSEVFDNLAPELLHTQMNGLNPRGNEEQVRARFVGEPEGISNRFLTKPLRGQC